VKQKGEAVYRELKPGGGYVDVFADGSGVEYLPDGSSKLHEKYAKPPEVLDEPDDPNFLLNALPPWHRN